MANTIVKTTYLDGSLDTIIKVDIIGDGSGEETQTQIFDASLFFNPTPKKKVITIHYALDGFSASLYWGATVNTYFLTLEKDKYSEFNFRQGVHNINIPGATGDIFLTTSGLVLGKTGYMIIRIKHEAH